MTSSEKEKAAAAETVPRTARGKISENAPLGAAGWFGCGGRAEILFRPEDREDLAEFLKKNEGAPVTALGALSNTIIRDGGVPGVTIRLGKGFTHIEILEGGRVRAGAAALDGTLARAAAEAGIGGLEFFSGIPGSIGGALRMNAGCYGVETKDVLIEACALDSEGNFHVLTPEQMGMSYRHTEVPEDFIFVEALFQGVPENPDIILARMERIRQKREESQPLREKTGGSTFANPSAEELGLAGLAPGLKVWQLIDAVGGRGLRQGGAVMSEKHCNFMINAGEATASDLEALGEEVRRRVRETYGLSLRWEIKRIGLPGDNSA